MSRQQLLHSVVVLDRGSFSYSVGGPRFRNKSFSVPFDLSVQSSHLFHTRTVVIETLGEEAIVTSSKHVINEWDVNNKVLSLHVGFLSVETLSNRGSVSPSVDY